MSINEILKNSDSANITVNVGLNELRQFLGEVAESKLAQVEETQREKSEDERLTPAETCKELGITRATLTRYDRAGLLPKYKIGGKCWYMKADVKAFISKSKVK